MDSDSRGGEGHRKVCFVWLTLTLQLGHNSENEENCGNVFRQHLTLAGIYININKPVKIAKGDDVGGGSV